ncbi:MAG: hypothetical protein DRP45_06330, partial [Candidatus Zixiibacteriota bacterium]
MVKLDNVTYWYREGEPPALRSVNLRVERGESICVMGRNGSGKSTLARLIASLRHPGRGKISINGQTVSQDATDTGVGILFQNPDNQMVAVMVEKELAFALENQAMPQEQMERTVVTLAERFGISHLLDRLTSELSGGEKQRVALASVMIQNPSVLVLDEPDSFLDETGRRILEKELERLHRESPELVELRITQNPAVAKTYKRLVVLDNGCIAADGQPSEIFEDTELAERTGLIQPLGADRAIDLPQTFGTSIQRHGERVTRATLEDGSFGYGAEADVLDSISMSLSTGEIVGLVGPTGVGKSSLALLLCGILEPTGGKVNYAGQSEALIERKLIRGQVVAILQQPERQFFLSTCAEEVAYGPSNLGHKLEPSDIDAFLDMVGLAHRQFRERDPYSLSAGEKRRLAFAAVLSMAPALVIFADPTAGLDQESVGRFMQIVRALKERNVGQLV